VTEVIGRLYDRRETPWLPEAVTDVLAEPITNHYFPAPLPLCPPHRGNLPSGRFFLRHRFLGDDDFWELHDVGDRLSGSILTEGRLERQFLIGDLG
jgi:hypothetical protein